MKKKLLAILLTVCMVLSVAPAALAANETIEGQGTESDPYNASGAQDEAVAYNFAAGVAQIGTTDYATLAAAIAAAKAGDIVTLLSDITVTEQITITDNGVLSDITLDGNGKTITANLNENSSPLYFGSPSGAWATGVKIKDLTVTTAENTVARFGIFLCGGTSSELTNVKVTGNYYYYGINFYGTHGATLDNCQIVSAFTNGQDAYPLNLTNGSTITTLVANDSDDPADGAKVFVDEASSITTLYADNHTKMIDVDSMDKIGAIYESDSFGQEPVPMAAEVNGVQYFTLAAAVAAAEDGDTVTLLRDVTLTEALTIDKDVTLDLGGKTVTASATISVTSGNVTVKNGTINSSTHAFGLGVSGATNDSATSVILNIESDVTVTATGCVVITRAGTLNTAGVLKNYGNGYSAIQGNGNAGNGGTVINITGGTVYSEPGTDQESSCIAIYMPQNGTLNITGGEVSSWSAIYAKNGTVNISGGTIKGVGAVQAYDVQNNGARPTGDALILEANTAYGTPTANITGGTFVSTYGNAVTAYVQEGAPAFESTEFISGGTFSTDVSDYCITGYETVETNGVWVLAPTTGEPVAQISNGAKYLTLAEAITAAEDGDTVTLLKNVTLTETVLVQSGKAVTLDLNGKTVNFDADVWIRSSANDHLITVSRGADLTITDSSEEQTGMLDGSALGSDVYGAVKLTNYGEAADGEAAKLTVNGGTLKGYYYGISGNGGRDNTEITINGGKITSVSDYGAGIYHPQNGTLTVIGGTIEGKSAIYFCGGDLNISGGTLIGNGDAVDYEDIVSGFQATGDALIIDNRYNGSNGYGEITASITGGTFTSTNAFAVGSYLHEQAEAAGQTAIDSFISGGSFTVAPATEYLAAGFVLVGKGPYTVEQVYTVTITIPDGASIVVKDSDGNEIAAEDDGTYELVDGTYSYIVSKTGYITKSDSFTVNGADVSFSVSLSIYIPYVPSNPSYGVAVRDAENGGIAVTPASATAGTTVTVTVDPDKGYTLETLTVTNKNGKEIELTKVSDTKYAFKMPASMVTVEATFMEDNTMLNYFVDVFASDYYYDAVLWAVENGITNGTSATTFSPNATCTRAQVVTFLWRAAGSPEPVSTVMPFTDVTANAYYYDAVLWAVENGITNGTSATTFSPDADCTRAQIVTFLWRSQGSENASAYNPFVDVANDAYYTEAVLWAVENDITNGTGANTFSPDADCTRGQIVTFLYRCLAE